MGKVWLLQVAYNNSLDRRMIKEYSPRQLFAIGCLGTYAILGSRYICRIVLPVINYGEYDVVHNGRSYNVVHSGRSCWLEKT